MPICGVEWGSCDVWLVCVDDYLDSTVSVMCVLRVASDVCTMYMCGIGVMWDKRLAS